ncbi:MAG TPA: hypothetical protein VJN90_08530 [Candidatus Acidoferrales bacterium]|nr:hypothetical protein [Candidatus Acidoferrales bacterium]
MNRIYRFTLVAFAILLTVVLSMPAWAQAHPKNAQGEEFFIISSVDLQKRQVVLMRPTQLTVVATIGPQTNYVGEKGRALNVKAMKAGDTVWAITKPAPDGSVTAVRLRQGAMTPAELHKLYMQLPPSSVTSTPPLPVTPMTPRPQSGVQRVPSAVSSGAAPYSSQSGRPRTRHHRPDAV